MKRNILLFPLFLMVLTLVGANPMSLKDAIGGTYSAATLHGVKPLPDGEHYARISDDGKSIVKYSFKTGQKTGVLFDANTARGAQVKSVQGYILSPDGKRILIQTETEQIYRRSKKATYYIFSVQNNTLDPLSTKGKQQEPIFSPDGNSIAFVRDNNIFLVKLLFNNAESQVTKDGKFNEVLNGIPDWVNEEEFTLSRALEFTADSKMLAWIRYDEKEVPLYSMQLFQGSNPSRSEFADYPGSYSYKYPIAGQVNAVVSVLTYDIKSHVTRTLQLPLEKDGYIPRIKATKNPDQLLVFTLNRHQSQLNLYVCNTRSLVCKSILEEKDQRYVKESSYEDFALCGDHFVWTSDRSGSRQLYWYSLTGQLVKQITNHPHEITKFYGYDARTGAFCYQAKEDGPLRTAIYRTDLKGKAPKKLSAKTGTNDAIFSSNLQYFINVYSNLTTPYVTSLCSGVDGKTLKTLIDNQDLRQRLAKVDVARKELFTFKTADGVELYGWMMKPVDFSESKKYPVILYQYSGPGSQEVQDSWNAGFMGGGTYESYLCSQGFIVACVDGRGTGGRGADFEKCTYLHIGRYEAADQVATALYLGGLPYVDKSRIGIWGWSFGGFNTLMSMSQPQGVFKAGVAVAAPTNFKFYDTIYTERYMRTPGENPDGYTYNPITLASKLTGSLLLVHGMADDNVHFRNAAEYSEALVQQGKQFDMQVYTNRNHSIYGGNTRLHLFTRISNFFADQLMK